MDKNYTKLLKLRLLLLDLDGVIIPSCDSNNPGIIEKYLSILKNDILHADRLGIRIGIISLCTDDNLINRIKSAGVKDVITGSINKLDEAEIFLNKLNIGFDETGYIGDDLLDIPLLQKVGFSFAPETARREVKRVVDYVCKNLNEKSAAGAALSLIEEAKTSKMFEKN